MTESLHLLSALLIGLLGGAHCVGMCGGIMGALTLAIPEPRRNFRQITPLLLSYNTGRIFSYSIAGALVGALGWWLSAEIQWLGNILRYLAGFMLIAMGLYLGSWWMGLVKLERAGAVLWRRIQPLGQRLFPVHSAGRALLLGILWGWLPCGLVYSTLIWAASAQSASQGALIMACFGLGTLPAVLATGYLAKQITELQRSRQFRQATGLLLIAFGLWTLPVWRAVFVH